MGRDDQLPARSAESLTRLVPPPHPAAIADSQLASQCDLRTQRRSGPGGQHRNKTSSGVFLHHLPTGVTAEATERRSQARNRSVALDRLRYHLAISVRTPSPLAVETSSQNRSASSKEDRGCDDAESHWRERYHGRSLRIGDTNPARPAVIALVLNDLIATDGMPSRVSAFWSTTTSSLVTLLKSYPPALALANQIRQAHGRPPLK